MGQPVTVIEKPSNVPGTVLFEINRSLTGTGHERYVAGKVIEGDRPPDVLARRLFERGGIESIHIYSNMITVVLDENRDPDGLVEVIEDLYTYYLPGVEVAPVEGFGEG